VRKSKGQLTKLSLVFSGLRTLPLLHPVQRYKNSERTRVKRKFALDVDDPDFGALFLEYFTVHEKHVSG
jgi:hypothetical protein